MNGVGNCYTDVHCHWHWYMMLSDGGSQGVGFLRDGGGIRCSAIVCHSKVNANSPNMGIDQCSSQRNGSCIRAPPANFSLIQFSQINCRAKLLPFCPALNLGLVFWDLAIGLHNSLLGAEEVFRGGGMF